MPSTQADQYAVMGKPIAHSKSPLIHAAFAAQTGQHLNYSRILVEPGTLAAAVETFRGPRPDGHGRGLNITVPLKQEAFELATELSPRAQHAGAVNTLSLTDDGRIVGDNTDGPGLVRDLVSNHHIALQHRRILLLGAGGASRGILAPLLEADPTGLFIANRTAARATELAAAFSDLGHVTGGGFTDIPPQSFDLIINATAASLQGELPPLADAIIGDHSAAYDLMYASSATPFMSWAAARSSGPCLDGLGMLVEQAAESFYLWRGQRPNTAPVIAELRAG